MPRKDARERTYEEKEEYYDRCDQQHRMLKNLERQGPGGNMKYIPLRKLPTIVLSVPMGDGEQVGYSDGFCRWTPYGYDLVLHKNQREHTDGGKLKSHADSARKKR